MPKFTVRRTVTAGVLGAAALGMLAIPAVANAETPDSIAALADTGSAGSSGPAQPGVIITQDRDGNIVPGRPVGPDAVPAIPLQPGATMPEHVIIQRDDRGVPATPGSPADTIVVSPAR